MINFIKEHKKIILIALILIIISIGAYLIYGHFHTAKTITTETQTQAETPAGVENAATNADVEISSDQAKEAADEIKEIAESGEAPSYTISTTAGQAQTAEKEAQESSGADFSIVTDPANPVETVDTSKLPADTQISLNQYNVQAYKKILHTVSYAPKAIDNPSPKEIGYSVAKKITKDGRYLGVGVDYNFDDKAAMVKLEYTW